MDALVFIIAIVWAIFSLAQKSQKKQKKRTPQAAARRPEAPKRPAAAQSAGERQRMPDGSMEATSGEGTEDKRKKHGAKAPAKSEQPGRNARPVREAQTMLPPRPASVTAMQTAMAAAAEGEDPCHEEMLAPHSDRRSPSPLDAPDESERAQDLLRGVIFAEILTRPADRRRLRMR